MDGTAGFDLAALFADARAWASLRCEGSSFSRAAAYAQGFVADEVPERVVARDGVSGQKRSTMSVRFVAGGCT